MKAPNEDHLVLRLSEMYSRWQKESTLKMVVTLLQFGWEIITKLFNLTLVGKAP